MPPTLPSKQGYSAYKKAELTINKSKEDMLLMLYEGALKFLRFAHLAITQQKTAVRGENLSKVLAILTELDCALDHNLGGEVTTNLSSLYQYMIVRVTQANIRNDIQALDEVVYLLTELQEGFEGSIHATTNSVTSSQPLLPPRGVGPVS